MKLHKTKVSIISSLLAYNIDFYISITSDDIVLSIEDKLCLCLVCNPTIDRQTGNRFLSIHQTNDVLECYNYMITADAYSCWLVPVADAICSRNISLVSDRYSISKYSI